MSKKIDIKREQRKVEHTAKFEEIKLQNLQSNCEDKYECRGRIQGVFLIYLDQVRH